MCFGSVCTQIPEQSADAASVAESLASCCYAGWNRRPGWEMEQYDCKQDHNHPQFCSCTKKKKINKIVVSHQAITSIIISQNWSA